jgi:cytochrome c553
MTIFSGCNYASPNQTDEKPKNGDVVQSPTASIEAKVVSESVLNTCSSCHAGKKNPNLSSLDLVKINISKVVTEVESNAMPPTTAGYAPLTNCQKAILRRWWEMGMPEVSDERVSSLAACANANTPGEGSQPPPSGSMANEPLVYDTFLKRIVQPKCIVCHNPKERSQAAQILFYPYSEILNQKQRFQPPGASSKIVHDVTRTDDERMPPPESKIPPLTQEEVDWLIRWIDAGIPEK